ncbi:MAG: tetratricopeptide repeat protein [Myxococcales bacterium]
MLRTLAVALTLTAPGPSQNAREARKLTLQSIREYNAGDFEASLRDAKEAYELTGLPALLFNLGQCHRMLGHWKEAAFAYERYLREQPQAKNESEVRSLLAQVRAKEAAAAAPPEAAVVIVPAAPTPTPAPAAPVVAPAAPAPVAAVTAPPARPRRIIPAAWWLGGSGAAFAIAGTILGVLARGDGNTDSGFNSRVPVAVYNRGQREGLTADIFWATGGALIVTGVVAGLVGH